MLLTKLIYEFLTAHKDADEIVVDVSTGIPIKAVYLWIRGVPRKYPATYYFYPF